MEDGAQEQAAQQPQQESGETQEKDYKALYEDAVKESRKWEKHSKESGVPDIRRDGCNREKKWTRASVLNQGARP